MGGLYSDTFEWGPFVVQFLNVHLLLFGGATAYNSYWDKDEGPIGGLKHPPGMNRWMWFASLLLQAVGLIIAIPMGSLYTGIYALSIFLFWLYSSPLSRWKSTPIKSLAAIGISTGTNSVLLGYLAAGANTVGWGILLCAFGVALVLLSLYPTSQIYQMDEDEQRGDRTFAVKFGIRGVYRFFVGAYLAGISAITVALVIKHFLVAVVFFGLSIITGIWTWKLLNTLEFDEEDYNRIMNIKYSTSLSFVLFLMAATVLKHTGSGIF